VLNGVPMAPDDPGASRVAAARRAEAGIGSDRPIAGSVVRLTPGKGLDTLLDAFALCRERVDGELLLVGDGPLRENLEGHARALGIAAHIHFVGHQSNPGEWMLALDTFVLPVPSGTMSIALLEAMARGVPPIITFGGPEEAVIDNETGLCPPPSQPQALADAMVSLLQDQPRRDALGRAAKEHVRKHFSVARVADDTLAVYAGARRGGLPQRLQASAPPSRYP
jgi:glycosyltransferase involved in cell wall biosynthesis